MPSAAGQSNLVGTPYFIGWLASGRARAAGLTGCGCCQTLG